MRRSYLGGLVKVLDNTAMEREANRVINALDLTMNTRLKVRRLSGGQRQAVAIGRALAFDAKLVIMDEPTANLAVGKIEKLMELTRRLQSLGVAVVIITHRLDEVYAVASRLMVMRQGQVVGRFRTSDIAEPELAQLIAKGLLRTRRRSRGGLIMSVENLRDVFTPKAPTGGDASRRLKHLAGDYGLIVVFICCLVFLSIVSDAFLTPGNMINVVRQSSIIGLIALGMTFVMITAGIDLSVGSVVGLAGVVAASFAPGNSSAFLLPMAAGIGVGLLVGFVNAALIVRGGVLPFLATLAVMAAARGATLIYTDGHPISDLSSPFQWLGAGRIGPVPVPIILFAAIAFLADHVLSRTRFGRHVYAVGGNPEAARTVGIPVNRVLVIVYLLAAVLGAFSGILLTARVDGADPLAGTGYELLAISAVVIGGTSLFGGIGTIRGTVLGVLLLAVVQNGLDLLNVSSYYQQTVVGLILIAAVLLNRWKSD